MTPWWAEKCHEKRIYGAAQTERAEREIKQMRARLARDADAQWEAAKIAASAKKDER